MKNDVKWCKDFLLYITTLETYHDKARHKHFQISSEGLDMKGDPIILDKCLLYLLYQIFIYI